MSNIYNLNGQQELVFVYGSLKNGFGNHDHFLKFSKMLGEGVTVDRCWFMLDLGCYPGVVRMPDTVGDGFRIYGEVYEVDSHTLRKLDGLEGNGSFYTREKVPILVEGGETVEAWMYVLTSKGSIQQGIRRIENKNNRVCMVEEKNLPETVVWTDDSGLW